jgi:hypothetical protein
MENMTVETMSQAEIETFAQKLEAFEARLTPREQAFLRAVLEQAAGDGDVEGQAMARTAIGALILAIAGTVGVANASAGPAHHAAPAVTHVHHVVSVVNDDKGGAETITYTMSGE